jgi:hypothetical protein
MIDINKKYLTRDGREVRIYATDGGGPQPVHGAISGLNFWSTANWSKNGSYTVVYGQEHDNDLIEVRPRHKRTVWLNVFHHNVMAFFTNEGAKSNGYGRIACIKVELDFEEGEGLNTSSERVKKTGES